MALGTILRLENWETVMAFLFRPTYTAKDPTTGVAVKKKAKAWYGRYADGDGITRQVKLSANKTAAQQILNELVRKAELARAGLRDPFEKQKRIPLEIHLKEWESFLSAGAAGPKHVRSTVS